MSKQRIEGTLHRDFDAAGKIETRSDGDNTRLTLSFSSETPYLRSSYWDEPWNETLGHGSDEVDLSRLNAGAPVLANHERYAAASTTPLANIGVVERAWLENGRGYAEIKLSRRPELAGLVQDLADGIVRNVSVGYQIQERTLVKQNPDGQPSDYRVTRWMPLEISLVDIPADATVGVGRSADAAPPTQYRVIDLDLPSEGDISMTTKTEPTAQDDAAAINAARASGIQAERARITEITDAVRSLRLDMAIANDLIGRGISADEARKIAITKAAERSEAAPITSHIETVQDETDTRRSGVAEALLHRYNPAANKLTDKGREFMGRSLLEIGRELLEVKGIRTRGMSTNEVATRAMHTTSDFPYILANVAGKTLRAAYESAPQTFRPFCRQVTAADFKPVQRTALGGAPTLEKVNEHGEYKYGTVGETKEAYSLASYGKIVALTRQTLINDDLDAFTRLPEMFGRAAADLESDTVWGIITANAALNDGVALFHATHNNLPAGAAISVAQLGVVRAAMRKQTGIEGRIINVTPQYLLVPAALETIAQQFTSTAYMAEAGSNINPFAGTLQVIAEPRLDATSATAWYAAAAPGQIDTIEYAYLEGNQGVYLETRDGWEVDGMEIKARLDFAAAAIDFRGLCKGN
jgi:hypothetical protein